MSNRFDPDNPPFFTLELFWSRSKALYSIDASAHLADVPRIQFRHIWQLC